MKNQKRDFKLQIKKLEKDFISIVMGQTDIHFTPNKEKGA